MTLSELNAQVALGEDSRRQFKQDIQSPDALAAEMAAVANSDEYGALCLATRALCGRGRRQEMYPMELPIPSPPHPSVLSRLLDPVGRCLTPEVAQRLVALQVDPAVQARLEELADKCTEGQLSADERTEYETYVQALEFIAVLQAQARSLLTNGHV